MKCFLQEMNESILSVMWLIGKNVTSKRKQSTNELLNVVTSNSRQKSKSQNLYFKSNFSPFVLFEVQNPFCQKHLIPERVLFPKLKTLCVGSSSVLLFLMMNLIFLFFYKMYLVPCETLVPLECLLPHKIDQQCPVKYNHSMNICRNGSSELRQPTFIYFHLDLMPN